MASNTYYVYMMASASTRLYVGVSGDLIRRVFQHKHGLLDGFTKRYRIDRLVYFESTTDIREAIQREKVLKGWTRRRKLALIGEHNPSWEDLSAGWYEEA